MNMFKETIVAAVLGVLFLHSIIAAGGQVDIDPNSKSDVVVVFELAGEIMLDIETTAFEEAMVDKEIEVVEVREQNSLSRAFIEPVNKQPSQQVVYTWSKKGSLLTLTAGEAVKCGAADKLIESREKLLADLGAEDARVVVNKQMQKAHTEFDRAHGQLMRIRKSVDFKIKQSKDPMPKAQVLKILRSARSEFKRLIQLGKKYPDLNLNIQGLEDELNSIEAAYQSVKRKSKRK